MNYLIIIDGEQFMVEAPHVLAAWGVAIAQAALMLHEGRLRSEDVEIYVFSEREAKREGVPVIFPKRLNRLEVLQKVESLRDELRRVRPHEGQATLEQFVGVRA
ncbi:hypothetical protein TK0415 [Thermococcus kodakarensis KOD1]|uniref:Uncharacterized protein n=1 Tax=Thermococcus kodakarensis (strain ATCC BAA-918 / JCM 12380 / KOD1) TaxID=69014 RepID=Q5JD14_THEKO|nr:hypothetical protein [Thermococcus kodakarensis]WCN28488.1 hypothetical protein POG15_02130 [Thermococcus kodakarensis]WCN30784.1 hypothetical protein POG21_02130 [Thermococcus kodakarensis]BAD84604.1 hypothetical protein TK0415 [Thermococcus kodakarensis KOD1]